jgi:pimeloyl-ACP methyl ester carboxylesterase
MRTLRILVVAMALVAAGCVRQQRFRFVPATTACFPETSTEKPVAGPRDQRPSLDCRRSQFKTAFIEFDEDGKMFDPNQQAAAFRLLESEKARAADGKVITVVYIHGWKNNAAEAAPGGKPKDVEKFQAAMLELGYRAEKAAEATGAGPVPIVGIYLAWRGKTLMGPSWFTFASLWSRRNTANNIGDGPDLGVILNRIIEQTNAGNDRSRVLLIGHSFGARVLEHAIESKKVELYQTGTEPGVAKPRVDLVLYVNSANDSRLSMARVQALQAARLRVHHPDFDPAECAGPPAQAETAEVHASHCRDYPLLVAITSSGDSATKYLLPLANTINGDRLKPELADALPPLPAAGSFADPLPSAGAVRKMAAGHFRFLQSHETHEITCPAIPSAAQRDQAATVEATIDEAVRKAVAAALGKTEDEAERVKRESAAADAQLAEDEARFERAMHPLCSIEDERCRFVFRTLGDRPACYQVDERPTVEGKAPFNRTPFWIMSVEPTVIKDHGDIWNVSFVEMLGQLMAPRGFFAPRAPRIQLRADPGASK